MFRRNPMPLIPGIMLCIAVSAVAALLEQFEIPLFGRAWLEALVLAIMLGAAVRTAWSPRARWFPGINFSAKTLLEISVLLLGASVSAQTVMAIGPALLLGIAAVVLISIAASYGVGRLLGLPYRIATLVACGNSICGNSAIATVAPVIGADGADVSASVAFTALLGVVVVLALQFVPTLLSMTGPQYGVLAGLTVYAVPQVFAATAQLGTVAMQMGTLVKLVRVLMLGPVVLALSVLTRRWRDEPDELPPNVTAGDRPTPGKLPLHRLVPWYILGFLALGALRSAGVIPHAVLAPTALLVNLLTIVSMAALGLGTDLRTVARAGGRVSATVAISLLLLVGISFALIRMLGVA